MHVVDSSDHYRSVPLSVFGDYCGGAPSKEEFYGSDVSEDDGPVGWGVADFVGKVDIAHFEVQE